LAGDTEIYDAKTNQRYFIKDLINKKNFHVWAYKNGRFVSSRCDGARRIGKKPIYQIKTYSGYTIKATAEHRFWTLQGEKQLRDMRVGDFVSLMTKNDAPGKDQKITDEEIKLLGYLISEGTTLLKHRYDRVGFTNTDMRLINDYSDCAKSIGANVSMATTKYPSMGTKPCYLVRERGPGQGARVSITPMEYPLRRFCEKYKINNSYCWEKRIPQEILMLPKERLALFLNRLYAGDGSIYARRYKGKKHEGLAVSYCTDSKELAYDVATALIRFGIFPTIKMIKKQKKNWHDHYQVKIENQLFVRMFLQKIGAFTKTEDIDPKNVYMLERFFEPGYICWDAIRSIKCIGEEDVYCLMNVKESPWFVANNFVTHNSATQEKAKEVVFGGLIEKIRQSPWFMKFGKSMKMLSEDLRFPKGIVVKGAESTDLGVVGLTTCVTGDTLINTPLGEKAIDYLLIKYGNEKFPIFNYSGNIVEADLAFITETGVKPVYEVTFEGGFKLRMTEDHRILIDPKLMEYKPLSELNPGDEVICESSLKIDPRKIVSKVMAGDSKVYDLTSRKNHNFIANGIVVHNCAVVIDEANIGRKVKAVHESSDIVDRTEAIYQAARRRIRTSFNRQGRPPTLLMTIGSRRYPSDFVDRRIRELQGEKNALVCDMSLYAAKGMENFSPKLFRVMVGNDTIQSRVLNADEIAPKDMQVIKVPEDFLKDYKDDCDGSLRDISGISIRTVSPYLADQKFLVRMVDNSRSHPFRTVEWKINETRDVLWDRLVYTIDGKNKPLLYPDKPRTVAIDLGRTRNPTGFTVGFVRGFKTIDRRQPDGRMYQENLPYIVVEFALRISPVTGEEIKFWQVRELIFDMVAHGIPIKYGVMDHYQSDDFVQLLTDQGIESKQIKTDIKSYETLKAAIYEERVRVYPYKPLMDELSMLEYDAKKNKVDTSPEDFGNIHHDVADSLCLLVNRLSQGFKSNDYAPVMPEMDLINRSGPDKKYQSVAVGDTPFELNPEEKAMQQTAGIPDAKFPAYGLIGDNKEVGWGGDELSPKTPPHMSMTPNPVPRMEVLVQEFCSRVGIDKLPSVTVESIKAFLFEKQLTDHRFVRAIKEHIERVYVNQLGGKEIK
jgi:intein/homing endonuclease